MPFCTSCGSQMNSAAVACPNCGAVTSAVSSAAPAPAAASAQRPFAFHGDGGTLLGIYLVTLLLSIVTLGVYSFWGRTNVRRYLWSMLEFDGDRFAYHGTGGELLKGWCKALLAVAGILLVSTLIGMLMGGQEGAIVMTVLFYGSLLLLIPVAQVGTWRYRLSRTSYRGIRLSFRGRATTLMGIYLKGGLLMIVTLGFYAPFFANRQRKFFCQNAYYGNTAFDYDGEGGDLFGSFVLMVLLLIPTLTLSAYWFQAKRFNYFWERTTFAGGRFQSQMTFGGLLELAFTNLLLVIFTLGIGMPLALVRVIRYVAGCLSLTGPLDLAAIQQQMVAAGATGEELGGWIDGGSDVGLGM